MNGSKMTLFACAASIAIVACAGESKPAVAPAATAATPSGATTATATETPAQAATSGNIRIAREILAACGISDADAFFPYDSSRLEKKDIVALNEVAVCFTTGPMKGRTLKLVGHADPRGPSGYNLTLGQARADSVQKYLTDKGGDPSKVESTSRGAMDATGTNEAGWTHDRRVDLML